MSAAEDIARLTVQTEELKAYLNRIDNRIETVYNDMGRIRENMATHDDLDRLREAMATSKDVERLWKIAWIFLTAIIGLLVALINFLLTKQPKP
ncbi:MAG: hypothetical protein C3F06_02765 [Candidatus Methanoperedenaceae archaeon]|nr:MAG: hypothetical protein C3F06_02765 [Candidatus Methanoperedenaceae archaeon]